MRIDPDKLTVEIAVTIAGAGLPEFDVTQDRAGVAANVSLGKTSAMRISLRRVVSGNDSGADFVGSGRKFVYAHAGSVVKRIKNCRRGGNEGLFANALCAERTHGRIVFNKDRFDGRNIANGGNQVIVEIFAFAGKKFFHEGHAESLRNAAFNLAFDESGINGAADVMGGGNFLDA